MQNCRDVPDLIYEAERVGQKEEEDSARRHLVVAPLKITDGSEVNQCCIKLPAWFYFEEKGGEEVKEEEEQEGEEIALGL